jgi:DNA-binding transcriptional MerR regulator/effector-binding domain-containing protein
VRAYVYSIGEFSRISGLSIKALRLYHEKGILVPRVVDPGSGYRYYDHHNVEKARIVRHLRDLDFTLEEITRIVEEAGDDTDVLAFFERKKAQLAANITRQRDIVQRLELVLQSEKEAAMNAKAATFEVQEKTVEPFLFAGIRFKGRYGDCGAMFGKIARAMGWNIGGKAFNLYYDGEYKETDADIESCLPVRKARESSGISVREFAGGRCVSLVHKGPYETLGRSYEKIMTYLREKGYPARLPIREVYLKGPGMIFRGRPENYLTEIQIFVDRPS